ncbi:acyl carrier protein [Sphingomonas sp. R86521]|uniref:acyl carrier protein n=1 Tax=Sphingomonas sp. R86521 TaxID=3093860 RepID=UPI0036D23385
MEDQLRGILEDVGGLAVPVATVGSDQDLFAAGLTSFATVTVMLGIEEAFDVEFPDALLNRATFRTIDTLVAAIAKLQGDSLAA